MTKANRSSLSILLRLTLISMGLAGATSGCSVTPSKIRSVSDMPYKGLDRLASIESFRLANEAEGDTCKLQRGAAVGDAPPSDGWTDIDRASLGSQAYQVVDRVAIPALDGRAYHSIALRVKTQNDKQFWLRNTPTKSSASAALAWRCAVDEKWVQERSAAKVASTVQLATRSMQCATITPILGSKNDVTLSPYTVTGVGLFAGKPPTGSQAQAGSQGKLAIGVFLEAEGGERRLTVGLETIERCFVPATTTPPLPSEAVSLQKWLDSEKPEMSPPPANISRATVEAVAGIDPSTCIQDQVNGKAHYECRAPVLVLGTSSVAGPFGPSAITLTRDRVIDAFHLLGDRLVSPAEVIKVNAVVRMPGLDPTSEFGKAFRAAVKGSIADKSKEHLRGVRGFRLMLEDDERAKAATHLVDLELKFSIPELVTTTERRTHKYIAGKKRVHNDAYDKAVQENQSAKDGVESAEKEAVLIREGAERLAKEAKDACAKAGSQAGAFGGWLAGAACGGAVNAGGVAAANARVKSAKERLAAAETALASTPQELDVDDERTWEYEAKILRRHGEAQANLWISTTSSQVQLATAFRVPFDALSEEVAADPEHKLEGKKASPPTPEDVQRAMAEALVPFIDGAIIKWGAQRQVGGDLGEMKAGTRSWMVNVARRAAGDRDVKLLSDIQEERPDQLARKRIIFPVRLPEDSEKHCYTFAAIPLDGSADTNLELAMAQAVESDQVVSILATDHRRDPDAGFEVCGLQSTPQYAVGVTFPSGAPSGVLVSMFESTPGVATKSDTQAASRGLPSRARKGEELALNGEGIVQYKGAGNRTVTGRTGDRDGDGVPDDEDRCPYDPETKNGYLDNDGCPDVPPAGWKPGDAEPEVAGAATNAPTQPPLPAPPPAPPKAAPKPKELEEQGDVALANGRPADAATSFAMAIDGCPKQTAPCDAHAIASLTLKLAIAQAQSGKKSEAVESFRKVRAAEGKLEPPKNVLKGDVKKAWEESAKKPAGAKGK